MKGQARSNRTYTGGAGHTGGGEKTYFDNNNPFSYSQEGSTWASRPGAAAGGQVSNIFNAPLMPEHQRQFDEGGAVTPAPAAPAAPAPQGYIHPQYGAGAPAAPNAGAYANTYQPGMNVQQQASQIQAAQPALGGIASLPQQAPNIDSSKKDWFSQAVYNSPTNIAAREEAERQAKADADAAADAARNSGGGQYAQGGLMNLRPHSKTMDPMFLRGGGDGMSDSIPAQIQGNRQKLNEPIRVANNEFIVPADVVSHLGNGSSDAGANKLHGMMDRVRQAKTGTKKQAPQIKPNKYLPA